MGEGEERNDMDQKPIHFLTDLDTKLDRPFFMGNLIMLLDSQFFGYLSSFSFGTANSYPIGLTLTNAPYALHALFAKSRLTDYNQRIDTVIGNILFADRIA